MINNKITNLISRIRQAILNPKFDGYIISIKEIHHSKEILDLCSRLSHAGFLNYKPISNSWYLAPNSLLNIEILSKSGKRIYKSYSEIQENEIVRTSKGFRLGYQARKEQIGGELILKILRGGVV
jgi:ribosomal protein S8